MGGRSAWAWASLVRRGTLQSHGKGFQSTHVQGSHWRLANDMAFRCLAVRNYNELRMRMMDVEFDGDSKLSRHEKQTDRSC